MTLTHALSETFWFIVFMVLAFFILLAAPVIILYDLVSKIWRKSDGNQ